MSDNKSLVVRLATKYGVESTKFLNVLKSTMFRQEDGSIPSNEQMIVLLLVADQYDLNPFTREIYAFPNHQNSIIPIVGVDGWSRIINANPQFDGVEFFHSENMIKMEGSHVKCPEWIECVIYRKDRLHSIKIREYLDEVYRGPIQKIGEYGPYDVAGPWQTHTKRQLRHKALIQCARIAFGFSGIYDQDEAERIREMEEPIPIVNNQVDLIDNPEKAISKQEDHHHLDSILEKLSVRAIKANAWAAAHEYINTRYHGDELKYAMNFLRDKEMDSMASVVSVSTNTEENISD